MPNWCSNDLTIEGETADVKALIAHVGGNNEPPAFDFNTIIPYPAEFAEPDRIAREWAEANPFGDPNSRPFSERPTDGYNSGGYEWCTENWGTKWNAADVSWEPLDEWDMGTEAVAHFDTAWAPPTPVILALSKLFPEVELTLTYFEAGMQYNGQFSCKAGEVTYDETGKYFGTRGG